MDNLTTEILDRLEPEQVAELPPGALNDLSWMLAQETVVLKQREHKLHGAFERRYGVEAATKRLAAGKDTGAIHLTDGEYDVCVNAPKKVSWDQSALRHALDQLPEDTARHYAKVALAVEERKFDAAPPEIRAILAPARTVSTGKTTFALSPLKQEAVG